MKRKAKGTVVEVDPVVENESLDADGPKEAQDVNLDEAEPDDLHGEDKGEENCLSNCQSYSGKFRNYKHSNNNIIGHLQYLEENHDIKILNSRTNINESTANNWSLTAENTSSQNKTSSLDQKKEQMCIAE